MRNLLIVGLVVLVAIGAVGYWRGWFSVTKEGAAKYEEDKAAFSKSASEKAKAVKNRLASLWRKSEGLSGEEKAQAEKDLGELEKKHERLEKQLKELDDAGNDKFDGIKQDLSKTLAEVERKIDELEEKLEPAKSK